MEQADGRIQVLAGGGISEADIEQVVREAGVDQVHVYVTRVARDLSTVANPRACFGAFRPESEIEYRAVDELGVARVRRLLDSGSS